MQIHGSSQVLLEYKTEQTLTGLDAHKIVGHLYQPDQQYIPLALRFQIEILGE